MLCRFRKFSQNRTKGKTSLLEIEEANSEEAAFSKAAGLLAIAIPNITLLTLYFTSVKLHFG